MIRPQYHFRTVGGQVHVWTVADLSATAADLPIVDVPLADIAEIDEPYWFVATDDTPTCRRVMDHAAQARGTDLSYPILLCAGGRVMDGMHRVMKAVSLGHATIPARRLRVTPPPDFVDVDPADLDY